MAFSQSRIIASRFSAKLAFSSALLLAVSLVVPPNSVAHQPVNLTNADSKVKESPILADGMVSWAVYANFTKASQNRYFRFALAEGERLKAEYLIFDRSPDNSLKNSRLPIVSMKSPSGKSIRLAINERSKFFEPFGGQRYLFLSRINQMGEAGVYTVTIRSRGAATAIVAVGVNEVRGEVMEIGSQSGNCPAPLQEEIAIPQGSASQLIGLTKRSAEICAQVNGWLYRVGEEDGEQFALTRDYRINRITVSIKSGRITNVLVG